MKELGVGMIMRKAASAIKPTLVISQNGKEWTIKAQSSLKNIDLTFTEDVEFNETSADGKECKSLVRNENGKLVQEQKDAKTNTLRTTITRELVGDKLVITYVAGSVVCKRTFKRRA